MTAPGRIGLIGDGFGNWALASRDLADVALHYILATPEALAASPEVQALIEQITQQAARDARDVYSDFSIAKEAVDYVEQLIYAAIRKGYTP